MERLWDGGNDGAPGESLETRGTSENWWDRRGMPVNRKTLETGGTVGVRLEPGNVCELAYVGEPGGRMETGIV